jgi:hypothetical protein
MTVDHETITEIERILDDRYVKRKDCEQTVRTEDGRITKMELKLENVNTKLGIMIAILSAIGVPVVALCVKLLFGG